MALRTFRNIYGEPINVLTKRREPNEIREFDVGNGSTPFWVISIQNEIKNLLARNYIEEVFNETVVPESKC